MKQFTKIFFTVLFSFIISTGFAQRSASAFRKIRKRRSYKYYYLGLGVNAMNYFGDLSPKKSAFSTQLDATKFGLGATFGRKYGPNFAVEATFSYGRIYGTDNGADRTDKDAGYRYIRNLHFRNNILELSVVTVIDFIGSHGRYRNRKKIVPYALVGIAGFHHNPQGVAPLVSVHTGSGFPGGGQWVDLQPLGTEGQYSNLKSTDTNYEIKPYSLWQVAIPFGLGVRFKLTPNFDISLDVMGRLLFFDYIDDVSRNYVDLGLIKGDLAKAMSDRSRESKADASVKTFGNVVSYVGRDGKRYEVVNGYGSEGQKRGSSLNNDFYYSTRIKLNYIIPRHRRRGPRRPNYR